MHRLRTTKKNVYDYLMDADPKKWARACRERNVSIYNVCSRYYIVNSLRDAYSIPVLLVPHPSEWSRIVPEDVIGVVIRPPMVVNKVGRPMNKHMMSQKEEPRRLKCGRCKQFGHNKKTCMGTEYVPTQE
ncbi:hypothetical protein LIER_29606 [Lithospermum erythrorhizon]|uniref:Uncharacterized protein n=1 Tax=Lithospermum erythrorhizon TaxID=34254 RepID=A0AAV3RLN2_LITER